MSISSRVILRLALFLALCLSGMPMGFSSESQILIRNGSILTDAGFVRQDILIKGDQITKVASSIEATAEVRVIDVHGDFVIPGLIDAHAHIFESGGPVPENWQEPPYTQAFQLSMEGLLSSGVTTARVHLFDLEYGPALKRESISNQYRGPRLVIGGPGLFGGRPELSARQVSGVKDAADIVSKLNHYAEAGVDWVALHNLEQFPKDQLQAIKVTARQLGLGLMADGSSVERVRLAIDLGVDTIEYLPKEGALPKAVLSRLQQAGAPAIVPPIGFYQRIAVAVSAPSAVAVLSYPDNLSESLVDGFIAEFDEWLEKDGYYTDAADLLLHREYNFMALQQSGATMLVGSDAGSAGQYHGQSIWTELQAWNSLGVSVTHALQAATIQAAEHLGLDRVGCLQAGCYADLVIINGDTEPSLSTQDVKFVLKGGVVFKKRGNGLQMLQHGKHRELG